MGLARERSAGVDGAAEEGRTARAGLVARTIALGSWWLSGPPAPWIALAGGLFTAFLWREGFDHVRGMIVLAALGGVVVLLHAFPPAGAAREAVRSEGGWRHRLDVAAWWTTVRLAQNALWFVIPFYVVSTTWLSANAAFTAILLGLGVLSCFDALLRERVLSRAPVAAAFVGLAQLAALQLVLPVLTGLPPRHTIYAAGGLAAALGASLLLAGGATRRRVALELGAVALCGVVVARVALPMLPPVPLRFVSGTFAEGRSGLDPVSPVDALPAGSPAPVYVFVAIEAPRGVRESVQLEIAGRRERDSRPLEIVGGRKQGYRLWADVLPPAEPGPVAVTVRTLGGQIVGRVRAQARAADAGGPATADRAGP
ncbi:MAG TPA: DUF5924 family protein [Myxococcota bacterium]|nr:DUF5924 family protein [Myxococcota bacterium]